MAPKLHNIQGRLVLSCDNVRFCNTPGYSRGTEKRFEVNRTRGISIRRLTILMYKVKYGLAPSIVDELFKQKSTSYSLRNSDFDIPTFNTINYGKHSLMISRTASMIEIR